MAINELRTIPQEGPIALETEDGGIVDIPEPSAHTGVRPVQIRVLSPVHREHMVTLYYVLHKMIQSPSSASGQLPASPYLILHCHGGGYVATSSKSHEVSYPLPYIYWICLDVLACLGKVAELYRHLCRIFTSSRKSLPPSNRGSALRLCLDPEAPGAGWMDRRESLLCGRFGRRQSCHVRLPSTHPVESAKEAWRSCTVLHSFPLPSRIE